MDFSQILNKVNNILDEKIEESNLKFQSSSNIKEIEKEINNFFKEYQESNSFNLTAYINLCIKLNIEYDETKIRSMVNTLNNIKSSDSDLFGFHVKKCEEYLNNLINILYNKLSENKSNNLEIEKKLYLYKKLQSFVLDDKFTILLDKKNTELFLEFLKECDISLEEYNILVFELVKSNALFAQREFNLSLTKKRTIKGVNNTIPSKIFTRKNKSEEDIIEQEFSSEKFKEIYDRALELVNSYSDEQFQIDIVKLIASKITLNMSVEDRFLLYISSNEIETQKLCVLADLKYNILPEINKGNIDSSKLYKILEEILDIYQDIINQEERINENKPFLKILEEKELIKEQKICHDVEELLFTLNKLLVTNYSGSISGLDYNNLFEKFESLKRIYDDYKHFTKACIFNEEQDINKEMMNITYEELQTTYFEALSLYDKVDLEDESEYLEESKEFYSNSDAKNIYLFLDEDDSIISDFEKDIIEDDSMNSSLISSVIAKLTERVSHNFVGVEDHKAKSDDYSEEFLKKYKVKSIRSTSARIFYSRFNTTLSSDFGFGEQPHIVFLLKVGYGQVDGIEKHKLNHTALKNCYSYKDKIDYIVDLFNTDWNNISGEEANKRTQEIEKLLTTQQIKLGHLLNTYKRVKGGKKYD